VPYSDRSLLGKASTIYPANIKKYYLQVPPEIADKVRKRTEEILANYDQQRVSRSPGTKNLNSAYEKALYLAQYLKQNYALPTNPLELPYLGEKDDLVATFLFKNKGGYPDHFSTVLTVMLRSIGIPARLVAGFAAGEFNPFTGMYVVRNTDAYAMTEVYFPKYGWFSFDPIPGHSLIPPSVEADQTFSVLR
ncbi:MAG: transglutaminase-like domain-containing protein, partial [Dolichospermum sp.]